MLEIEARALAKRSSAFMDRDNCSWDFVGQPKYAINTKQGGPITHKLIATNRATY